MKCQTNTLNKKESIQVNRIELFNSNLETYVNKTNRVDVDVNKFN